jgi:hypothetical protein
MFFGGVSADRISESALVLAKIAAAASKTAQLLVSGVTSVSKEIQEFWVCYRAPPVPARIWL